MRIFFLLMLLLHITILNAQRIDTKFIKPINLPFNLAGSFAEPRPNHFHAGIDIKTNQQEGYPIIAIADGFVSRLKIASNGYGRVLYVQHLNGYTSVYAHLSKFSNKLQTYALKQIYLKQQNEIDITLKHPLFKVKQGDTIGYSGNTGSSTAPHLHFEIRETITERALNPLDFYPSSYYVDVVPPTVNNIYIKEYVNTQFYLDTTQIITTKNKNDINIIVHQPYFTFALDAYDKQDNSENKNGIRSIYAYQDNLPIFSYNINDINFNYTKFCNVFFDYGYLRNNNGYAYNCYQTNYNHLAIYPIKNKNYYTLNANEPSIFKVDCLDYNNNKTTISFTITYIPKLTPKKNPKVAFKEATYKKFDSITMPNFKLSWLPYTFYDAVCLNYQQDVINQNKYTVTQQDNETPLHTNATVRIYQNIEKNTNKVVLVQENSKQKRTYIPTKKYKNSYTATIKELGTFYLDLDTIAPTISLITIDKIRKQITAEINDLQSEIQNYNVYLDNKWIHTYYDAKNNLLIYEFDQHWNTEIKTITYKITDKVGNTTIKKENISNK